jgi:hypothetical protein
MYYSCRRQNEGLEERASRLRVGLVRLQRPRWASREVTWGRPSLAGLWSITHPCRLGVQVQIAIVIKRSPIVLLWIYLVMPAVGEDRPRPLDLDDVLAQRSFAVRVPTEVSPDGRWVAYTLEDLRRRETPGELSTARGFFTVKSVSAGPGTRSR